jgi:hypothetical protein
VRSRFSGFACAGCQSRVPSSRGFTSRHSQPKDLRLQSSPRAARRMRQPVCPIQLNAEVFGSRPGTRFSGYRDRRSATVGRSNTNLGSRADYRSCLHWRYHSWPRLALWHDPRQIRHAWNTGGLNQRPGAGPHHAHLWPRRVRTPSPYNRRGSGGCWRHTNGCALGEQSC